MRLDLPRARLVPHRRGEQRLRHARPVPDGAALEGRDRFLLRGERSDRFQSAGRIRAAQQPDRRTRLPWTRHLVACLGHRGRERSASARRSRVAPRVPCRLHPDRPSRRRPDRRRSRQARHHPHAIPRRHLGLDRRARRGGRDARLARRPRAPRASAAVRHRGRRHGATDRRSGVDRPGRHSNRDRSLDRSGVVAHRGRRRVLERAAHERRRRLLRRHAARAAGRHVDRVLPERLQRFERHRRRAAHGGRRGAVHVFHRTRRGPRPS